MSSKLLFQSLISYCVSGTWDLVDDVRGLEPKNVRKSNRTLVNGSRNTLPQPPGHPRPHEFSAPDLKSDDHEFKYK